MALLESKSAEGCCCLLQRLPREQKSVLRMMLNSSFPGPLRWQAWRMFLIDPISRNDYATKISKRRIDTISSMDTEITQKCQMMLEKSFSDVVDDDASQRNVLIVMKTVLSYFHTVHPDVVDTQGKAFYLLMMPILVVYGEHDQEVYYHNP